jgi:hypothetical protein
MHPNEVSAAELANAELVIVIWSKSAITAPYVLSDTIAARDANKLMHVTTDEAPPKQIPMWRRDEPFLDASELCADFARSIVLHATRPATARAER